MDRHEEFDPDSDITREGAEKRIHNRLRRSRWVQRTAAATVAGLAAWMTAGPPEVHEDIPREVPVAAAAGAVAVGSYAERFRAVKTSTNTFHKYADSLENPGSPSGMTYSILDPDTFELTERVDGRLLGDTNEKFMSAGNLLSSTGSLTAGGFAGLLAIEAAKNPDVESALLNVTTATGAMVVASEVMQYYGTREFEKSLLRQMDNMEHGLYIGEPAEENRPDDREE